MTSPTMEAAIAAGNAGMARSTAKAVSQGFDTSVAKTFVLGYLRTHGPSWSEAIVEAAGEIGYLSLTAIDGRAWGSVFGGLSRKGLIRCVRADGIRKHGNGTAGARQWAAMT